MNKDLVIFFHEEWAFLKLNDEQAVCLGTREEIRNAPDSRIAELIRESVAINRYNEIRSTLGIVVQ